MTSLSTAVEFLSAVAAAERGFQEAADRTNRTVETGSTSTDTHRGMRHSDCFATEGRNCNGHIEKRISHQSIEFIEGEKKLYTGPCTRSLHMVPASGSRTWYLHLVPAPGEVIIITDKIHPLKSKSYNSIIRYLNFKIRRHR